MPDDHSEYLHHDNACATSKVTIQDEVAPILVAPEQTDLWQTHLQARNLPKDDEQTTQAAKEIPSLRGDALVHELQGSATPHRDPEKDTSVVQTATGRKVPANSAVAVPAVIEIVDDDNSIDESALNRSCHTSIEPTGALTTGVKRKRVNSTSYVGRSGEDDVQILPDAPPTTPRSYLRNLMRKHASTITGYRPSRPHTEPIDLDAVPDKLETMGNSHNLSSHSNTQRSHDRQPVSPEYSAGSLQRPIDVDNYISNGSPSRLQSVNGQPVGMFHNGQYLPYSRVPVQQFHPARFDRGLPSLVEETRRLDGPSHVYNGVSVDQRGFVAGQTVGYGHQTTGSAINSYTQASLPDHYRDRLFQYQYREENQQSQLSSDDLQKLIANIKDADIPPEQREPDPVRLTKPLMAHQKIGLSWMKAAEEGSNRGGILADAMGLGKTIQAISLILSRPPADNRRISTLVVAPVALLRQWQREIQTMTYPAPSIYVHHGPKKLSSAKAISAYDIVLTSFNTVGYEEGTRARFDERPSSIHSRNDEAPNCPIVDVEWFRVILDEAHFIKNKQTKSAIGCGKLKAVHRWALTGTPMQNSLDELYSLISFLRIKPYNEYKRFQHEIVKPLSRKDEGQLARATQKVQALLTAIMLRRTKDSQIDGKAILQLPKKHSLIEYVTMGEDERERYVELEAGAQRILQRTMQNDKANTGSNMLVQLLKLRQMCDHPLLPGTQEKDVTSLTVAEGTELARTLKPEVVDRLKRTAQDGFECPVCFDVAQSGVTIIVPCGHYYCGECLIQQLDCNSRAQDGEESATCAQCRSPFDMKKCISLKHFQKAHCPDIYDEPEDDAYSSMTEEEYTSSSSSLMDRKPKLSLNSRDKGKGKLKLKGGTISMAERFFQKYKLKISEFTQSAKIQMIQNLIFDVRDNRPGEKTIVFSQFTSFLDLIEIPLRQANINFLRYDGSLDAAKRNDALIKFEEDPTYNVILVSLKAGNVGLNLTCANHVILSEPFWNPYVETQSEDRAHRIGQTREVFVRRLIIKDSVESRVLAIQEKKRALIEGAMDPTQSAKITKLDRREIAFLFGFNNGAA